MKKLVGIVMSGLILFGLTACSQSTEEKIVGKWELIDSGEELTYWEITEDEITILSESGEPLSTHEYILNELKDEKFKLEFNELSSENMGIFRDFFDISMEAYFENKNTIIGSTLMKSSPIGDFKLVRLEKGETTSTNEKSNLYSINRIEYSIPESWTEEISDKKMKYYYPEEAILMVAYKDSEDTLSNDEARTSFIEGFATGSESFDLISESEITIAGTTAYQFEINNIVSDKEFETSLVIFNYSDGIIVFQMGTLADSNKNYNNEFERILSSIKFLDE